MKRLYACWANGRGFVKRACSESQFRELCLADERARGYSVPPAGRGLYWPDWEFRDGAWRGLRGASDRARLPWR